MFSLINMGCYSIRQGWHQLSLLNSRRDVADVIADSTTPAPTREALTGVGEILSFAVSDGLNVGNAYSTFVDPPSGQISWLVHAAYADRLEYRTWWFPFVGRVPYLGYFERAERDREAERMRAEGFDVSLGAAGAFSSLGWFSDPIYSPMLRRPRYDLARLLFHELTHRTLWVSGDVPFNESLAEFVSINMTRRYLESHGDTNAIAELERDRRDEIAIGQWIDSLKRDLKTLYKEHARHSIPDLATRKREIISRHQAHPPTLESGDSDAFARRDWNNATVLAYSLYRNDLSAFQRAWDLGHFRVAGSFLEWVRDHRENLTTQSSKGDPRDPP